MDKITLSSGRELDILSIGSVAGYLFIRVAMSEAEAREFFNGNTEQLVYTDEEGNRMEINGFKHLAYIVVERNCVRIALTEEADG